ncbi:cytochrome C oxidase subunit II [Paenibacillus sp. NPDC058071]|uniref:cytochrome C oxidase subunit II n=1 Tax=Paenibacillus sp. NPDC058071 TaxID=3346326 RepID=UPI0036DDF117
MKKWAMLAATLCFVFVIAACGGNANKPASGQSGVIEPDTAAPEVVIKAKNWEFDQAEYKIKAGENINLKLESTEGVHGIRISKTKIQIDNNKTQTISLDAGEYEISCYIPCGGGHTKMKSKLIVE